MRSSAGAQIPIRDPPGRSRQRYRYLVEKGGEESRLSGEADGESDVDRNLVMHKEGHGEDACGPGYLLVSDSPSASPLCSVCNDCTAW